MRSTAGKSLTTQRWLDIDVAARTALFAFWTLSLCLPVWRQIQDPAWVRGWYVLMIGWIGPIGLQFWFGNLLLITYVLQPPSGVAKPLVKAMMLAITFLFGWYFRALPTDSGSGEIAAWGSGYYVWMGVIGATAAHCLLRPFLMEAFVASPAADGRMTGDGSDR